MKLLLALAIVTLPTSLILAEPTPSKAARVEQLLKEARAFCVTGRFDIAFARCEQVLNVDPFSSAARALEERISRYQKVAANSTPQPDAEIFHPVYPSRRVGPLPRADRFK